MAQDPFIQGLIDQGTLVPLSGWQTARISSSQNWADVPWWQIPDDTGEIFVVAEAPLPGLTGSDRTGRYWSPTITDAFGLSEDAGQGTCWRQWNNYHSLSVTPSQADWTANCAGGGGAQRLYYDPGATARGIWPPQASLKFSYQATEVYQYVIPDAGGGGVIPATPCPDAPPWPYNEDLGGIQDVVGVMRFTRKP